MEQGVTTRRSSFITGTSTRSFYEVSKPDKDAKLKEALCAVWRPNMGYRIAHDLVKAQFAPLNVKRVHRLWKEGRFGVVKRYRKKRTGQTVPYAATVPNEVWTIDFVFDACMNGSKLKILSVLDEVTRECLALEVATSFDSQAVKAVLETLFQEHGAPKYIRSDNGGEFIARVLAVFLSQSHSGSHFIQPGKPWQNAFVESFHSTLRRDHLDVEVFLNLADAQMKTAVYRRYYNEVRPHSSLGRRAPSVAAMTWKDAPATPPLPSKSYMLQSMENYS
jgi:putative transposase